MLDAVIKGDTVREVLDYVEFEPESLIRQLRDLIEVAVREGRIDYETAGRFARFYGRLLVRLYVSRKASICREDSERRARNNRKSRWSRFPLAVTGGSGSCRNLN